MYGASLGLPPPHAFPSVLPPRLAGRPRLPQELAQSTAGPGFLKADASGGSPSVNPSAARAGKKPVQLPRKITIETTVRGLSRLEKKLGTFLQRSRGGTPPEVVVVVSATPAGEPAHAFTGPIRIPAYGAAVTIMAAAGTQRPVLTFKRKKFDGYVAARPDRSTPWRAPRPPKAVAMFAFGSDPAAPAAFL